MPRATPAQPTTPQAEVVSPEKLLARARALVPVLRERRRSADEQRRLPAETVDDFRRLGFIRAALPERFGGMAHDLEVVADFALEIARGCGASGWLCSFMPLHSFMVGWFPERAQEEYWASSANTLSSTVPAFKGMTSTKVAGGLEIQGSSKFSSGIDHADWALVMTTAEACLVPREDFAIIDDWHVSGLRATGSKSVAIERVFVPDHRILPYEQLENGAAAGARLYDSPWYRVHNPLTLITHSFILAPVIGMARGVLDIFDERVRTRIDPQTLAPAIERAGPQLRFAEASAEVDAAEMFLRRNLAVVREAGRMGEPLSVRRRAEFRRDVVYAAKLVVQATNRLVDGMDSSALYDTSGLHRQALDVRAGALQFVLHWEETAMQFTREHWALERGNWALERTAQ